jgi:dTMP kinase
MASRAELIAREILPSIVEGQVVLVDRFFLSTYAYQIFGRGLPEEEIRAANRLATVGLVPDMTLMLDVPATQGLSRADARGARDRMERADDEFHQRVANAFRQFADPNWQHSHPECGPIKLIDGTGDEEIVHQRIVAALTAAFPEPFGALKS